jgi:WD40 repeat protein
VGAIHDADLTPDGTRVVTAGEDGTARLFHAHSGDVMATWDGFAGPVTVVRFAPDTMRAYAGSADRTVRVLTTHPERMLTRACAMVEPSRRTDAVRRRCADPTFPMR